MEKNLKELSPRRVWEKFYEITRVPRPSHHEDAIREYLLAEAHTHGIEAEADAAGNVIMRKAATPGMESRKGIVLQAHMDMVPQKNGDKAFDFVRDPIEAYVDGEWVKADGTTLGADNGMGMAAILAVLESDDIEHGPIEALITATEETGMVGANGLKGGMLRGDILVNLDSETEGELYVGCAGGLDASITFSYEEESVPASSMAFLVEVKGLKGGHSGIEIVLERGNANLVLFRLLKMAEKAFGLRLSSVDGGGLRNAIPARGPGRRDGAGCRSRGVPRVRARFRTDRARGAPGRRRRRERDGRRSGPARFADRYGYAATADPCRARMSERRRANEPVDEGARADVHEPGPRRLVRRPDRGTVPVAQLGRQREARFGRAHRLGIRARPGPKSS